MSPLPASLLAVLSTALATALATWCLALLARRFGLGDASRGAAAARKLQGRAVPAVGGAALVIGLALAPLPDDPGLVLAPLASAGGRLAVGAALLLAFAVGLVDDLLAEGLRPRWKLLGQALAAAPLAVAFAVATWGAGALLATGLGLAALLAGVTAMNVLNTFDNADGALTTVALTGFGFASAPIAGALIGFLPFNLNAREGRGGRGRDPASTPSAYLGDSGSHLLGVLVLLAPPAWPALLIPGVDLARLAFVRLRAGSRPWVGDRRHLAHRLLLAGFSRPAVAALLGLASLPACLGAWVAWLSATRAGGPPEAWAELGAGLLLSVLAYLLLLARAPEAPRGPSAAV